MREDILFRALQVWTDIGDVSESESFGEDDSIVGY